MSHERHDLSGGGARKASAVASPKAQTIKLVAACTMLATAAGLIAWQSGIFRGTTPPPATTDTAAGGTTQQAPDSPEIPVTKTGSGRAKPLEQK